MYYWQCRGMDKQRVASRCSPCQRIFYHNDVRTRPQLRTCCCALPPVPPHDRFTSEEGGSQVEHGKRRLEPCRRSLRNVLDTVSFFFLCAACCSFFTGASFLQLLCEQAQSICFKIQCDQYLQTAAKDATGERAAGLQALASTLTGQGITVSNIVDYMSLIEQRSIQVRYLSWSVDRPTEFIASGGRVAVLQTRHGDSHSHRRA